jgi:uncharacterized YccA/Bax inhibitor family protein
MRSNNPVLRDKTFQGMFAEGERMTMNGTIAKTGLLLILALVSGAWTWHRFDVALGQGMVSAAQASAAMGAVSPFIWGGLIGGLVLALITVFKKQWAGITAPLYALAQGFALGGISALFEMSYHGIVLQAVGLTFGVLAVMLVAYRAGWIKVTDKFRMAVVAGTGAIMLLYLVDIGLSAFNVVPGGIGFIHQSGWMGIGFSLLVVGLAAMNLALDFDMIDQGTAQGAPKYMEWFGAFALMVTLVWLYLEILRLLGKLRR